MKYLKLSLILTISLIILVSCNKRPGRTGFGGQQGSEQTVIIEDVITRDLNEYIRLSGILEGKTDISLNSEVSGKIVKVLKKLGDEVKKGETIAQIDNTDLEIQVLQAESAVLSAEASKESAERNFKASESLFKEKTISENEYYNALSNYKNATAQWQGALANLKIRQRALKNSKFISPVSGVIVDLPVQIGQFISINQKIAGIVNPDTLFIRTGIGSMNIQNIKRGQPVSINYCNKSFSGKVAGVGYKLLSNIANYPVEIEIPNSKRDLIPGFVVNAEILSTTHKDVIFTSLNYVLKEYDLNYVYVIDNDNTAQRRNVKLGRQVSENVIITEGLNVGDKLVVEGYDNLEPGMKVISRYAN